MRTRLAWSCCVAVSLSCSGPAPGPATSAPQTVPTPAPAANVAAAQKAVAPAAVRLEKDTALEMEAGGELTGPKGWLVTRPSGLLRLEDPSNELFVTMVARKEADPAAAIAAAWKIAEPGFARPIFQAVKRPARDGWDASQRTDYDVPSREGRVALALARQKKGVWYIALVAGKRAAAERRSGELNVCLGSLKAPGVEEESFRGKKAHKLDADRLGQLEKFTEAARQKLGVPGVALALVQGGKVIYQKGFGVRELGKPAKVTAKTLFLIGSINKSMTSLMMAAMVDRGKLTWETPVAPLLPGFALGDEEATRKLTLRHTVCACTGLPRQDMEMFFEYSGVTPEKRLEGLSKMKPTTGFGEAFQYSNAMVSAGGFIAAHVLYPRKPLGAAYDAAMAELVFRPLKMTATTFDFKGAARAEHAMPHAPNWQLRFTPISLSDEDMLLAVRPAGGAWSNLRDMSRYVLLHLQKGTAPGGRQVVSEENLARRYEPQVRISKDMSYGLGLAVDNSKGIRTIQHNGGTMGFATDFFFLPEHDFGAVILTNAAGNILPDILHRRLLELLLDGRDEAQGKLETRWKEDQEGMAKEASKVNFAPPAQWLKPLCAEYGNPILGKLIVRMEGDGAVLDAGEWKSRVGQKKDSDGTFKLVLLDPPRVDLEFLPGSKGRARTLLLETAQQKYLFVQVKP
jgi:CubicO group peptidase (beta-lactamase class C family)